MGAAQRGQPQKITMKNFLKVLLFSLLFSPVFFLAEGRAEETPGTEALQSELEEVKTRLANIEKQQQDIAAKDDVILEKLDQLRVWVHRK